MLIIPEIISPFITDLMAACAFVVNYFEFTWSSSHQGIESAVAHYAPYFNKELIAVGRLPIPDCNMNIFISERRAAQNKFKLSRPVAVSASVSNEVH